MNCIRLHLQRDFPSTTACGRAVPIVWSLAAILIWMMWTVAAASQGLEPPVAPEGPGGWIGRLLKSQTGWVWFLAAFLGGLALNLTPCVYPMLPVTLAFFSGQAPGRIGYTAWLGVVYVLGMSLTYAVLGLAAAKTGALLGSWLQQPVVLLGVAGVVGILALGMFGVYDLRPPRWATQRVGQASAGSVGALVMGLAVGVVAAPCIGPFVLGLLLFVSQLANPWLGFWLFLIMGIGMGLPFLLLGVFANQLSQWPKAGPWLVWVKKLLGVALLGLSLYFLKPLLVPWAFRWIVVAGLVLAGVYLGWLERSRFQGSAVWAKRLVGLLLVVAAGAFIPARPAASTSVAWQSYSHARLETALREERPVIIDVYADWCLPCVELDHVTFRHPQVVERLANFAALRVDATRGPSPEEEELLARYDVYGVPTVLIFGVGGQEREDLRVIGFVRPQELLARLNQVDRHETNTGSSVGRRQ